MVLDLTKDKSTLVQVMAWCRQATSHYLSQCWPRSLPPYGVTRPQWVKKKSLYSWILIKSGHQDIITGTAGEDTMTTWCQLCRYLWHWRLSFQKPQVLPVPKKLASWHVDANFWSPMASFHYKTDDFQCRKFHQNDTFSVYVIIHVTDVLKSQI